MKIIFCLCSLVLFTSCNVIKNPIGKYRSNFAIHGFFITEIELKPDNSFDYKFDGDLQHKRLEGKYIIEKNKLFLKFNKLKNEIEEGAIKVIGKDTIVDFEKIFNSHSYDLKKEKEIEIEYHLKYKISKNKLQSYHIQTEKLVRKFNKYSSKRRYLIFGPKNYKKRCFLKKVINKPI